MVDSRVCTGSLKLMVVDSHCHCYTTTSFGNGTFCCIVDPSLEETKLNIKIVLPKALKSTGDHARTGDQHVGDHRTATGFMSRGSSPWPAARGGPWERSQHFDFEMCPETQQRPLNGMGCPFSAGDLRGQGSEKFG